MEERAAGVKWKFSRDRELGRCRIARQFRGMSLTELEAHAIVLSADDRRKLIAFLLVLHLKETGEWERATRNDDEGLSGWISLGDAKSKLLGGN